MFRDLASKMMNLHKTQNTKRTPSVLFGSFDTLSASLTQKSQVRVAMLPALSQSEPVLAMGLMAVLAYLLENYEDVTVYRQFVRLEGEAADFQWSVQDSQFEIEEWQLDGLDDNAAIWGALEQTDDHYRLTLEAEFDQLDGAAPAFKQQYTAARLTELVALLPTAAFDFATYMKVDLQRVQLLRTFVFDSTEHEDAIRQPGIRRLLERSFYLEVDLLLHLWGQDQDLFKTWLSIYDSEPSLDRFAAWLLSCSLARLLLPGISARDELPEYDVLFSLFEDHASSMARLARALETRGDRQSALHQLLRRTEELETAAEQTSSDKADLFFTSAALLAHGGMFDEAYRRYQQASTESPNHPLIYLRTAEILSLVDDERVSSNRERIYADEILQNYDQALTLGIEGKEQVIAAQLFILLEQRVDEQDKLMFVSKFEQLVALDEHGEFVKRIIEELGSFNHAILDPVLDVLRGVAEQTPERVDRQISLAAAYIAQDNLETAASILEKALTMTTDPAQMSEIQQLMLRADDPEFEAIIGEIIDKISAKTVLDDTEIDYLEQVVAAAPRYAEAYLLLAQGYELWRDPSAAIETLLDAASHLPTDAEILFALAKALLTTGQQELAIEYLQRSTRQNPLHVPTLALLGKLWFDTGDVDEARNLLLQAENIAPRNPTLLAVRAYIARRMSEQ